MDETDRELTKPPERPKEAGVIKQTPIRLHVHDHTMLMSLLKRDGLSLQKFMLYCVRGYLEGHPQMLKMLKELRELDMVPKDVREKHMFSLRERMSLFDEIEKQGKDK